MPEAAAQHNPAPPASTAAAAAAQEHAPHVLPAPVNFNRFADTAALTSAMAAGDGAAIESFYREHFDRLYRDARRCTRRDESFCLDVVQESVLRIVRTVRRVESEPQLLAWLRLIVRTTAYDLLRAESRRRRRDQEARPTADRWEQADAEQLAWLRRRIASMDPRIVQMIELRYHQRWSLARMAGRLGLSIGTIDGRLRRALRHLRELAREELNDD